MKRDSQRLFYVTLGTTCFLLLAWFFTGCSAPAPVAPAGDLGRPATVKLEAHIAPPPVAAEAPVEATRESEVIHTYRLTNVLSMRGYYQRRDNKEVMEPNPKDIPALSQECAFKAETLRQANDVFRNANATLIGQRRSGPFGLSKETVCALDTTTDELAEKMCTDVGEALYSYDNKAHTVQCRASH